MIGTPTHTPAIGLTSTLVMTAPSHLNLAGRPVSRRRLRRLSRLYATVGVTVPAARLRQIANGCPASATETVDITFAEVAIGIRGERRHDKRVRAQRRCVHSAIVAGSVVVALIVLICLALAFFMLAAHTSPF